MGKCRGYTQVAANMSFLFGGKQKTPAELMKVTDAHTNKCTRTHM